MIHDYTYELVFNLCELSDRGGAEITQTVTFNVPFEQGLDVAYPIVEDIQCTGCVIRDTKNNRTLSSQRLASHSLEADAWKTTFKEMLAADAGLFSELQRYCHDHAENDADERETAAAAEQLTAEEWDRVDDILHYFED